MGYAARANKSAETAAAANYRKPERVTVARVRRARRSEARNHAASLVAMQAIHAMLVGGEVGKDAALMVGLAGAMSRSQARRRAISVIRSPEPAEHENVSGANALQREAVTADPDVAIAQEGAPLTESTTTTESTL